MFIKEELGNSEVANSAYVNFLKNSEELQAKKSA